MPRTAKLSKNEIADILAKVFETQGYGGASLAMLAAASGLSKASLYHHFPRGKEDMAAHVLARAGIRFQKYILAPLMDQKSSRERLLQSLEGVALYYSGEVPICLMNSLMLGEGYELFGEQVKQAVEIWKDGFANTYADMVGSEHASAWAVSAIECIQGALILCRLLQSRTALDACLTSLNSEVSACS